MFAAHIGYRPPATPRSNAVRGPAGPRPTAVDTAMATLRAGAHRTDAHGPDGDEGDGCGTCREKKLIRCVPSFDCEKCYGIESAD